MQATTSRTLAGSGTRAGTTVSVHPANGSHRWATASEVASGRARRCSA